MRPLEHLRYEKPEPPSARSLWPATGQWRIMARLERWPILLASALVGALVMAFGLWALVSMNAIAMPDALMPFGIMDNPMKLVLGGGVLAVTGVAWFALALRLLIAKFRYALRDRASRSNAPNPDYGVIDLRSRRKRT